MVESNFSYGITFNGHHSTDFGVDVGAGKVVGFPTRNVMEVAPLNSNSVIDLSNAYGPSFGERTISIPFVIVDHSAWTKNSMYRQWTRLVNWLMQPQVKVPLRDDIMPDYHYLAKVKTAPEFQELQLYGTMTVVFTCYPFRIRDHPDYDDDFDYFIEHEDYLAQEVHYKVGGFDKGNLINIGVSEVPITVTASDAATLTVNGNSFTLSAGDNTNLDMVLAPGDNALTLTGKAGTTADFSWHQEMI